MACNFQQTLQKLNGAVQIFVQKKEGAMNTTKPTTLTSVNFLRTMSGSSSAPVRNVRTTAPEAARNRTHSESAAGHYRGQGNRSPLQQQLYTDFNECDREAQGRSNEGRDNSESKPQCGCEKD